MWKSTVFTVLTTLLLAGCGASSRARNDLATLPVHPDLQCPPGTLGAGTPPPKGTEVWCEMRLATGALVREGPSIQWHPNGRKRAEGSYVADQRHGPWLFWYPTGNPEAQGSYTSGVKEGAWTTYDASGSRTSEGLFIGGQEHGMWTFWDDAGARRTEGEFVLGARTGRWLDHGPDGIAVRERIYREGRLVSQREL
ncbi:MAG TPA: hypothetical protein ENK18_26915 [Deltaproteobacteria bacterium]|nr:hypothetical protein [Deltaproteobacteria bacterium]